MANHFAKLLQILKQKNISLEEYQDYLKNFSPFQNLSSYLTQQNIDLSEFKTYLEQSLPRKIGNLEEENEIARIEQIGLKLLTDSKIELNDLNTILQNCSLEEFHPRTFLLKLVRMKKIQVQDFLELDQENWTAIKNSPYQVRKNEDTITFFLTANVDSTKTIGPYQILGELGRGGMGIVYKCYHPKLNQTFSLKVLIAGEHATEHSLKRFFKEIQMSAKLKHPNIVQVFNSGEEGGQFYFAMEYVEGITLEEWLKKKKSQKSSMREKVILFKKCLDALHYAHEQGVIHRDLKPDNILINLEGEPKIMDFGLAKDLSLDRKSQKLTQSGAILGTPAYMSPEQAKGEIEKLDARSDVYSMGACLYQILSRKRPFESPNMQVLLHKIINVAPLPPSKLFSEMHADLETIVLKSLEKSQEKRYQTAKEFSKDLERFLAGYPIKAKAANSKEKLLKWGRRNQKGLLCGGILFGLCFTALLYLQWFQGRELQKNFGKLLEKANQASEASAQIGTRTFEERARKIKQLLQALNHLNYALRLKAGDKETEQKKWEIGKKLVALAGKSEAYYFGEFIAKEMESLGFLSKKDKRLLLQNIHQEQTKKQKKNIEKFEDWVERFQLNRLNEEEQSDAIFEISKFSEEEIFQRLIQLLKEGTEYFLNSKNRTLRIDEFYETMVTALGHLANPKGGRPLLDALKQMEKKITSSPIAKRSIADIQYMVLLSKALGKTGYPNLSQELHKIRFNMSRGGIFWERTNLVYRKLIKKEGVLQSTPTNAKEYNQRAFAKVSQRDFNGAIKDYTKAIRLKPNSAQYYNRASVKQESGDLLGAIEDYAKAIQLNSKYADAYASRGIAKARLGNYKEAIKDYNQSLSLNPNDAITYYNRAVSKHENGDFDEAIQDYNQAIYLNPQYSTAYNSRGNAKYDKKELREAIKDYDQAIRLNPGDAQFYYNRAITRDKLKEFDQAIEDYNQAVRYNPKHSKAYCNRGNVKFHKGDVDGAINDFNEALRLNPKDATACLNRGVLKFNAKKDKVGAKKDFQRYLNLVRGKNTPYIAQTRQQILAQFPDLEKYK